MQNALLDEAQAGIKTAKRYINNIRYADHTTLMKVKQKKEPLDKRERGRLKNLA